MSDPRPLTHLDRGTRRWVSDAEDLLQDALLTLWLRHQIGDPQALRQALRNCAFVSRRSLARQRRREAEYARVQATRACSPEDDLVHAEAVAEVQAAIDWLLGQLHHPAQRETARRRILHEQTFDEIAHDMQVPVSTAHARWARAKERMRQAIDREKERLDNWLLLDAILTALAAVWCWLKTRRVRPPSVAALASVTALITVPFVVLGDSRHVEHLGATARESFVRVDAPWSVYTPQLTALAEPETNRPTQGSSMNVTQRQRAKALLDQAANLRAAGKEEAARQLIRTYDLLFSNPYKAYRESFQ